MKFEDIWPRGFRGKVVQRFKCTDTSSGSIGLLVQDKKKSKIDFQYGC